MVVVRLWVIRVEGGQVVVDQDGGSEVAGVVVDGVSGDEVASTVVKCVKGGGVAGVLVKDMLVVVGW